MEFGINPSARVCDCPCPVHHRQPRRTFTEDGCLCTIVCSSQPLTVLSREWAAALFLTADGGLWLVNPYNMPPQGAYVWSPGEPFFGERTVWDWANAGPIHEHSESYETGKVIATLMRQLATTIASGAAGETVAPSDAASGGLPDIRYTGVVYGGTGTDGPAPSVNVFGHTEDSVYQGIFGVIAVHITEGEQHDTPQWWLEEHPIAGVRVREPGAAQEWLEGFADNATYPHWTVLERGSLLDMRQPDRPSQ